MIATLVFLLLLAAALGAGLVAGVFFAFSTFVMKALGRIPDEHGIRAMQSINVVVLNAWFLGVFLGTAALCVLATVIAPFATSAGEGSVAAWTLAGCALYLVGTLLVTIVRNVPRNEALAAVDAASSEGARLWADYLVTWTFWNHVRTAAALIAAACLTLALRALP